jgi:transcriptional regulator of aromatic amino acid metabolism
MVELLHRYSNPSHFLKPLVSVLRKIKSGAMDADLSGFGTVQGKQPSVWRLVDRLSEQEVAALLDTYRAGTPSRVLAVRYSISPTSVKRLLREHGVRRQ